MTLVNDIRLDIGDDDGVFASGAAASNHNLLSAIHSDVIVGSPLNGSLIVGNGTSWYAFPSGEEGLFLATISGGLNWANSPSSSTSGILGPSSSVLNSIATFADTTGGEIKSSLALVDDNGNITIPSGIIVGGRRLGVGVTWATIETENYLTVTTTSGVLLALNSSPSDWEKHIIKDGAGVSNISAITIHGSGNTIDGNTSVDISNRYGSITLVFNSVEWNII